MLSVKIKTDTKSYIHCLIQVIMGKEKILSNVGFFLGLVGIVLAVIPFFSGSGVKLYSWLFPIILGLIGLVLVFKIRKELNDDVVKAGLVANPIAIGLGIIQLIMYLIK